MHLVHALVYALVYAPGNRSNDRFRGLFLNETIRADFLIKRLNKKIEGNCLNKHPFCDRRVPARGTVTIYVSLCLRVNARDETQGQKGTH